MNLVFHAPRVVSQVIVEVRQRELADLFACTEVQVDTIHLDPKTRIEFEVGLFPVVLVNEEPMRLTSPLRSLLERLEELRGEQDSDRAKALVSKIKRAITRSSMYAVSVHEGRRVFDPVAGVSEKPQEYGRERFLDGRVYHLDLPQVPAGADQEPQEAHLMRACRELAPLTFLGVKPRDKGVGAVFLPAASLEQGLQRAFGDKIAASVIEEDRLDRVQFLTILAHREGQRCQNDRSITFPTRVVDDEAYDGLIADLAQKSWQQLLEAFQLPMEATWLQVSVFDKEQGLATKGAIRLCPENSEPAVYSASWKIGLPTGEIASSSLLVHESDVTYRPEASLNLQQVAYNFHQQEQEILIHEVFIPGVQGLLDYQWASQLRGVDRLLAAGADMRIEPVCMRVNALRKKLVSQALHRSVVPGFRAKVAPCPSLAPYECRLPVGTYQVGQIVDLTRDPSLPVGNSTQRYQVVGHTEGFTVAVGQDPWMSVQGGDFDGDDCCVQRTTVELFPTKVYDRTPVSAFRNAKGRRRRGVQDDKARLEQALRVLERPIGIYDMTARKLMESGQLVAEARLKLSKAIQASIDLAKHSVDVIDPGYGHLMGDYAIDAIRKKRLEDRCIQGTLYEPLVAAAVQVRDADLIPISFDDMPVRLAYAALAARFPTLADVNCLAGLYSAKFAALCKGACREIEIEKLADACSVEMEKLALRMREEPIDMNGAGMSKADLCLAACEIALLRRCSLHFSSRVVRMKSLRLVFDRESHFVRQAIEANRTHYLR